MQFTSKRVEFVAEAEQSFEYLLSKMQGRAEAKLSPEEAGRAAATRVFKAVTELRNSN